MPYGLSKETIVKINHVFENFKEIEEVVLYGSRAKGTYKNGSDIDMVFLGEKLNLQLLNKISLGLDDLFLPYTFDISIYNHINSSDLIEHVQRVGKTFYRKT